MQIKNSENQVILIFNLFRSFSSRRKFQLLLLLLFILVSSFTEILSISSVLPFIALLTSPEKLYFHPYLHNFNFFFKIKSPNDLIIPITVSFVTVVVVSGIFRTSLAWLTSRITAAIGSELSTEIFKRELYKPYISHISQNSSEVINKLTHKVDAVVFGVIFPFFSMINSIFLIIAVFITLCVIQPYVSIISMLLFGVSYFLIALFVRKTVRTNNKHIVYNQSKTIKVIQESLGGIRDIILDNNQDIYINQFREADIPLRKYGSENNFIGQFPRFTMEIIGIVVIAFLAYYLTNKSGSIQTVLPILGAIGVGSQRLLPAIQQLYNGWASLTGNYNQLSDIISSLNYHLPDKQIKSTSIHFNSSFELLNISFRYANKAPLVLNNVNLLINKGTRIGFIGKTGVGKSTLLDIIMGLLLPTSGEILVDGKALSAEQYIDWQSKIAHVPQSIFLSDCSIAENIAFGIHPDLIDLDRVKSVAEIALVSEFVFEYPNKYNTIVGERGVNLSGGQRQRIGIARALYKNAEVLILDEATSALDNLTESRVMEGIMSLNRNLTIFIIAHRLSTLQGCDYLIEIRDGQIFYKNKSEIFIN